MKTFNLDPAGFTAIRKRMLAVAIPFAILAVMGGIYLARVNDTTVNSSPDLFLFILPLLLVAIGIGGYRGMKRQQKLWNSYRLIFDKDKISRVQDDVPTITISKSDITEITESPQGHIQVKSGSRHNIIVIPPAIADRDELILALGEFGPLVKQETKNKWAPAIPILLAILMIVFFVSKQQLVIVSTGIILFFGLLWSFFEIRRSKLVDQRTKRSSWFIFLVLTVIIVKVLTALNVIGN
jgi:hypothetical protein